MKTKSSNKKQSRTRPTSSTKAKSKSRPRAQLRTAARTLAQGKLPAELLARLIAKLPQQAAATTTTPMTAIAPTIATAMNAPGIIIPPGIGLDAAGLNINGKLLAVTTDPITFTTDKIGTYCIAVNINDVACLGCAPRWFSATLLLPVGTNVKELEAIWDNLSDELRHYNIQSIGGHVEVTPTVNIPLIIGQMIGEALGDKLLDVRQARAGDKILLWRPIAIEGSAIIAKAFAAHLQPHFAAPQITRLQNSIHEPGICILPLVKKLVPCDGLVGLHDTTEGGVATALHDIADASGYGLRINYDAIPMIDEMAKLVEIFDFDPLGLVASGSVLIVCRKDALAAVQEKLRGEPVALIGELTNDFAQRQLVINNKKYLGQSQLQRGTSADADTNASTAATTATTTTLPLPRYDTDEVIRVLNTFAARAQQNPPRQQQPRRQQKQQLQQQPRRQQQQRQLQRRKQQQRQLQRRKQLHKHQQKNKKI
jgi:hydrogenase expression/formation protein HypE